MGTNVYQEHSLDGITQSYQTIIKDLMKDVEVLKTSLEERERDLEEAEVDIDLLNQQISSLYEQLIVNEDGFNAAIDVLFRLSNFRDSLFNMNDLRILTSFSLYEVQGEDLYMLGEQGTTETPIHINVNDPSYAHYLSIKLFHSDRTIEYATSDREGRTVASYLLKLPSQRVLIYNFHYDSTNQSVRGIIDSKEMYRFIRIICIHLEERGLLHKEGGRHANEA